jgi:hypothetical protein
MERFGFKDCGEVPCFQLQGTKLVPMLVSALLREDFEEYVKRFLVEQYRASKPEPARETLTIVEVDPEPETKQVEVPYEPAPPPLNWL